MSNTLPIALTRLLEHISTITSVLKKLTHMTTMMCVGSLKIKVEIKQKLIRVCVVFPSQLSDSKSKQDNRYT